MGSTMRNHRRDCAVCTRFQIAIVDIILTAPSYIVYLVLAIMAARTQSKPASWDTARTRSYSYRGVDAPELQTDRDVPEMSTVREDRPPSYRASSMELPPEVEKELV